MNGLNFHDEMVHKMITDEKSNDNDWGKEYSKLADLYAKKCKEVRELKDKNKQITAEVIDELLKQVRKEEKWLFKVIGSNQNINIAFGGIYAKAEQLKERNK